MKNILPQIKVYDIDYGWIVKNYLNPEMWQKTWTLFVYKTFVLTLKLYSISCADEKIVFEIQIKDNDKDNIYYDWCDDINRDKRKKLNAYYSLKTDNINLLKREIESKCFEGIMYLEKEAIRALPQFRTLVEYQDKEQKTLKKIANDFLDKENVTNSDIREAYVDAYLDKCSKTEKEKENLLSILQGTILSDLYLIFAKASKNQSLQNRTIELLNNADSLEAAETEIKECLEYIDSDEYITDQEGELEDI